MRVAVFLFILTLPAFLGMSQEKETPDNKTRHQSAITLSPLPAFGPELPRWKAGYIRDISRKWKIGVDIGIGHEALPKVRYEDKEDGYKNYLLWEIRPEIYFILNPDNTRVNCYFSSSIFYIRHTETFDRGSYRPIGQDYMIRYDHADYLRQKYGMHFKFGMITNIDSRFGFNWSVGGGGRIRNNQFSNVHITGTSDDTFHELDLQSYRYNEGNDDSIDLMLDVRIFYRFPMTR